MEPIDLSPRKHRPVLWVVATSVTAIILAVHAYHAWLQFWPGQPCTQQLPFTKYDHPLQFYYGQLTRQFMLSRGAFWGYDPAFMAGYAKSIIFPTSSTLPDLVAIVSGRHGPWAYNLISTISIFLTPIFVGLAAGVSARRWPAGLLALFIAVQWTWCSWPNSYTEWGMGPFILTSAISVLAASLLSRWLDGDAHYMWLVGTVLGTLAVIVHPLSLITLFLLLTPAYLVRIRFLSWRMHLSAACIPLVIALFWAPWWVPAVVLRDTYGISPIVFVNENIRGRFDELLQAKYPEEISLLVGAMLSCPALLRFQARRGWYLIMCGAIAFFVVCAGQALHRAVSISDSWRIIAVLAGALALDLAVGIARCGEARAGMLIGGAIALLLLAYFGGAVEWLWRLQPGRFTQPLYALLIVLVSDSIPHLVSKLRDRPWKGGNYQALISLVLTGIIGAVAIPRAALFHIKPIQPLSTDLPQAVHDLVASLRNHADDSGRILFEDRGRLDLDDADPFGAEINPSALMPILAPGQYIGGPYLYTNLHSNFTQFGDDKFFGRPMSAVGFHTFEQYATLYNIRWLVCWSPPMIELTELYPDYFHRVGQFGPLRLYSLNRDSNWAVSGRARVHAAPDRLEVSDAEPDANGSTILSYHWISTLRSTAAIRPVLLADDPVPFIAVDKPPSSFVIENRLW